MLFANALQHLDEARLAERLAPLVRRVRHAIRVEAQHITRGELRARRLVLDVRKEPEEEVALVEAAHRAVARHDERDLVSRPDVAEPSPVPVDLREHHRHERPGAGVRVHEPIEVLCRALEIVVVAQEVAVQDGVNRRGEKRRGDALAADVGDREHDRPVGTSVEDVVAIPRDLVRADVRGPEIDARDLRQGSRQEALLRRARKAELDTHALHLGPLAA